MQLQEERLATAASLAALGSKAAEDREALEEATVAITSLTQQIELAQQGELRCGPFRLVYLAISHQFGLAKLPIFDRTM